MNKNMGAKDVEEIYLDNKFVNLILGKAEDIQKFRRLKIGKGVSTCELQEIMYLKSILCRRPCYVSEKDIFKLEQRLINISNGY